MDIENFVVTINDTGVFSINFIPIPFLAIHDNLRNIVIKRRNIIDVAN